MITHYAISTELGRQRQAEIAASFAASRRPRTQGRRRWSARSLRHRLSYTATATAARSMLRRLTAAA